MFLPCLLIVLLRPIITIRFGYFRAYIIGHLALDPSIYYNQNKSKFDFFYFRGDPCNKFMIKKLKKVFNIYHIFKYFYLFFYYFNFNKKLHLIYHNNGSRDFNNVIKKSNIFEFTGNENDLGKLFLKKIFSEPEKKLVCLLIRDKAYKDNMTNHNNDYHDYRNSDPNSYIPLIDYLIKNNFNVIRMGNIASTKISYRNKNFYDYPFSEFKNDFYDIWLMSNCFFVISNGSGLDEVSKIFQVPRLYLNKTPLVDIVSTGVCMTAPKKLFNKLTNKFLNIYDQLNNSSFNSKFYKDNNIELLDLTSNEMTEVLMEFISFITLNSSTYDTSNQMLFWDIIKNNDKLNIYHNKIDSKAMISEQYLNQNKYFLGTSL